MSRADALSEALPSAPGVALVYCRDNAYIEGHTHIRGMQTPLCVGPYVRPVMRNLILLRHAKSDWTWQVPEDFDRPLNKRGRAAASHVGQWMKRHHLQPDWVISSPAARTRETLVQLRTHLPIADTLIDLDDRVYLADMSTLLVVLADCPQGTSQVLLLGHNPGLEELLIHLCGDGLPLSNKGKLMPTATLAQIALPEDWHALAVGSGKIVHLVRPNDPGEGVL